jgi:hypothetical protein
MQQHTVYMVSYDISGENHTPIKKPCCENGFSEWVRTTPSPAHSPGRSGTSAASSWPVAGQEGPNWPILSRRG